MRTTPLYWICLCGELNLPADRQCKRCGRNHYERCVSVHPSERAVVYRHPLTGEHRTPARADQPMPDRYAKAGFERHEIRSMTAWEKQHHVVHEASTFASGNDPSGEDSPLPATSKQAVIDGIRDAISSGPWTDRTGVIIPKV